MFKGIKVKQRKGKKKEKNVKREVKKLEESKTKHIIISRQLQIASL